MAFDEHRELQELRRDVNELLTKQNDRKLTRKIILLIGWICFAVCSASGMLGNAFSYKKGFTVMCCLAAFKVFIDLITMVMDEGYLDD